MLSGKVTVTPMKMPMMVVSTMEISSAPLIFTRAAVDSQILT